MAEALQCAHCGDESPPDARFCIACGAALAQHEGRTDRTSGEDWFSLVDLLLVVLELLGMLW